MTIPDPGDWALWIRTQLINNMPHPYAFHKRNLIAAAGLFLGFFFAQAGVIFWVSEDSIRIPASDLLGILISTSATIVLLYVAYVFRKSARHFWGMWLFLGFGQLFLAGGDILWTVYESILGIDPYPSLADLIYLLSYPLIAIGLWMMPDPSRSLRNWVRTAIDIVITALTVLLIYWNYLLVPMVELRASADLLSLALAVAYPLSDLILIIMLIILLFRMPSYSSPNPLWMLGTWLGCLIVSDLFFSYQSLIGTYETARPLDLGWSLGYVLAALTALSSLELLKDGKWHTQPLENQISTRKHSLLLSLLPNAWIPAAFGILLYRFNQETLVNFNEIIMFVGGITLLVIIRQWITLDDNERLSGELRGALEKVNLQARDLERANQEMQQEIQERRYAEERLWHDALHDSLTGLPNRALFLDRLTQSVLKGKRIPGQQNAVLFLDLDSFKVINDSLGHLAGDRLLIQTAEILQRVVRATDTVARLGGDEFVILLEGLNHSDEWSTIAERLQKALSMPLDINGTQVVVSASIGVVPDVAEYEQCEDVLRDADLAMYHAKSNGKARYELFKDHLRINALSRLTLENELRHAIENRELLLHYQPIFELPDEKLVGFEALVRWQHPTRGLILPGEFIGVAEETGLILPLGEFVLEAACRQAAAWRRKFPEQSGVQVRVNISGLQLQETDFSAHVAGMLKICELAPDGLVLEVTESIALNQLEHTAAKLRTLHALGVQIEIDDFGTGYSSLSYIHNLPIHALKIDRSFIHNIVDRQHIPEMLRAILVMVKSIGINAVAEGIEDPVQLAILKELGCNYAQGFYLSPPLSPDLVEHNLFQTNLHSGLQMLRSAATDAKTIRIRS